MDDQDDVEEGDVSPFERFKQAWRNERIAPALLPFDEDLVEDIKQMLKDQRENLEINRKQHQDNMSKVMLDAMELECDRLQASSHMSASEQIFCQGFTNMLQRHFVSSFLDNLPSELRNINKPEMFVKPNLDTPVFIKVLQDSGEVQVDDDAVTMNKGDVKVVKYRCIEQLLLDKKVALV